MRQPARLITLLCLLVSAPLHAAGFRFETIDFPGAVSTTAYGVNARGEIVGIYFDDEGSHSFLLRNGVHKTLRRAPGASAMLAARGINARGDIVGNFNDSDGRSHGYLLRDGRYHQIDLPGSDGTLLSSINNAGDIVGFSVFEDGRLTNFIRKRNGRFEVVEPFDDSMVVRSIKDNGRVLVGTLQSEGAAHGFIRRKPGEFEIIDYPGLSAPCSFARFINQAGDLVGNFAVADMVEGCNPVSTLLIRRGYLLQDGEFKVIHFPGAIHTDPFAINDDGMIVGSIEGKDGRTHAFKAVPRH